MIHESSAGVLGWAFADVRSWDSFGPPAHSGCVSFNHEPNQTQISATPEEPISGDAKVRKVRSRLGENNAHILEAIGALDEVSQLIMFEDEEEQSAFNVDWVETEIEICLDSGCCDHVLEPH